MRRSVKRPDAVEMFPLHEQLADLTEEAPVRAFVKALASHVFQRLVAPGAGDGIDELRHGRGLGLGRRRVGSKRRIFDAFPASPALPANVEAVFPGLVALAACPHMPTIR
jgi:hypothetical protein